MGLASYLNETKEELKHVSWPTKKQVTFFTISVIVISVLVAAFLGFFDAFFSHILGYIV